MILFWRKKPWVDLQHEEEYIPKDYSERGVDTGAKLEEQLVGNVDLEKIFYATESMDLSTSNSRPQVMKPMINRNTLMMMVIMDTDSGTKFASTIANPAILLMDAWLGIIKKNTDADMMEVARVRMISSFISANFFINTKVLFYLHLIVAEMPGSFNISPFVCYDALYSIKVVFCHSPNLSLAILSR